jgi:hypothetical protein
MNDSLITKYREQSKKQQEDTSLIGTGLFFEGICLRTSTTKFIEGDRDGAKTYQVTETAQFDAAGMDSCEVNLWHDLAKDEEPYNFQKGLRYRFFVRSLKGGWSQEHRKTIFVIKRIEDVEKVTAKGKASAA